MSTTVTQDMSFLHLISSASLLVQLVMLILVMISPLSTLKLFDYILIEMQKILNCIFAKKTLTNQKMMLSLNNSCNSCL